GDYEQDGELYTEKSDSYNHQVRIEGFNHQNEVTAQLYKVNKNGERSRPLEIKFTPLESVVKLAYQSLDLTFTFGGVIARWENLTNTSLGVHLIGANEITNEMETKEVYFSAAEQDVYAFRGFESEEATFGVYFQDKWGNLSDTVFLSGSPLYETVIEKPYTDFRGQIPYD